MATEVFNIPITNTDPGPDGVRGTGDDPGKTITTFYDYADQYAGFANQQPTLTTIRSPIGNTSRLEIAVSRRLAQQLAVPGVLQRDEDRRAVPDVAMRRPFLDPNAEINEGNHTWEWGARASGSYLFPYGIQVSSNFEHRSGDPLARTISVSTAAPSRIFFRTEPLGASRLPNINLMDVRFQKNLRMGGPRRLELRANVFNLLNTNVATQVTTQSGPSYGLVPARVLPRIMSFEVQYRF